MTLKARNRLFFVFFIASIVVALVYTFFLIYAGVSNGITPPENPVRPLKLYTDRTIFTYSFVASVIAILLFIVYVPIGMIVLYTGFENTQSIEIIYFSGFVIACFTEGVRIILPLFGLWETYSLLFIFVGRIVFAGRMLAPLSLLFAAIFSESEQRQNVERNYIILLVVSIVFAVFAPLDTANISSTCTICWGYRNLFVVIRVLLFLATLITIVINAVTKDSPELRENAVGYVILMSGYSLLLTVDNYTVLVLSIALFAMGNVLYLRSLHTLYMWR